MCVLWTLCLIAFSTLLSKYLDAATKARTDSEFIGQLVNGPDLGFEAFFNGTCRTVSSFKSKLPTSCFCRDLSLEVKYN